ncbi:MAG: NAD(P)-binding protein [Promethearchaeota archaeon]
MAQNKDKAMVIGGGIAGIQASLDLADRGIKVELIEKEACIGGRMAQLDKTFPTNDCSICILAPKLSDCSRHPNITLHTLSEVVKVEKKGKNQGFSVKIFKKARFVDIDKCTGCNDCADVCPVEVDDIFNMNLMKKKAISRFYTQGVPGAYNINKRGVQPCLAACPANVNVQGYVALTSVGKFKEALAVVKRTIPFPRVIGRICPHECETQCNRKEIDEPVAICEIKRFLGDYVKEHNLEETPDIPSKKKEKIAIIGSGPCGLTAANNLARIGYQITVFEALSVAGGMLAVGIPDYRLPRDVLKDEINAIKSLGVEIKLNTPIGKDLTIKSLLKQGYKAVLISTGAHKSMKLNIDGEDLEGVYHGVNFLRDVNLGKESKIGKRVVVIGGGDVAIDSVRTAIRLGSEAFILYRRSRKEMPALSWEVEEAEEEGVKFHFLATPVKIIGKDGKVSKIECIKMKLGELDKSGRRKPIPIKGSEFTIDVDTIIPAIGQRPDNSFLSKDDNFNLSKWETFEVNSDTLMTNVKGIFAGGDNVSGPKTAIEAIAYGNNAAESIDKYLQGKTISADEKTAEEKNIVKFEDLNLDPTKIEKKKRQKVVSLPVKERITNFKEVIKKSFTEEMAIEEAKRCLNCSICSDCRECFTACKAEAINYDMKDETIELEVESIIVATGFDQYDPSPIKMLGYGKYKNVVTGLEYERMLSASGPTKGVIERPSDHHHPKTVAFIQCVGSRDVKHNPYCSAVCCTYSTKSAILSYEHDNDVKVYIFYIDLRAAGKGFQKYIDRAKNEYNVTYIKGIVSKIYEDKNKNLILFYEDIVNAKIEEKVVDIVVLASSIIPSSGTKNLGKILNVKLNKYNFVDTDQFSPLCTNVDGIFACGCIVGPTDIPSSVTEASGAAAKAAKYIENI